MSVIINGISPHTHREEEIIMPDEHSGQVREDYQWKVLLQRSAGPEGAFVGVADDEFGQDLFLLCWGPTIAALSYVYDRADDKTIAQKAIGGFRWVGALETFMLCFGSE